MNPNSNKRIFFFGGGGGGGKGGVRVSEFFSTKNPNLKIGFFVPKI